MMKRMNWFRIILIAAVFFCASAGISHGEREEIQRLSLWPGESVDVEGVSVSYRAVPSATPGRDPHFVLDLVGPRSSMRDLHSIRPEYISFTISAPDEDTKWEAIKKFEKARLGGGNLYLKVAYLDGVVFRQFNQEGSRLELYGYKQEAVIELPSKPSIEHAYVSELNPIEVEDWHVTVGSEEKTMPDGTIYVDLTFKNMNDGTEETIPSIEDAYRTLGRCTFTVGFFDFISRTCELKISSEADFTIQGGNTYTVDARPYDGWTPGHLDEFLDELGAKYHFEVEWEADPELPWLVDELKQIQVGGYVRTKGIVVKDIFEKTYLFQTVNKKLADILDFTWPDSYHLIVSPNEDYKKRLIEERKKNELDGLYADEENEVMRYLQNEMEFVRTVIKPKRLSSKSIVPLVERELKRYIHVRKDRVQPLDQVVEEREYYAIVSCPLTMAETEGRAESFIVDEKQNVIIVEARPETIERIRAAVDELESVFASETSARPSGQYRIEAILLEGVKEGQQTSVSKDTSVAQAKVDRAELAMQIGEEKLREKEKLLHSGRISEQEYKEAELEMLDAINEFRSTREGLLSAMSVVKSASPEAYGISKEDLALFDFSRVYELGKGSVNLLGEKGEMGIAKLALSDGYSCRLEFLDVRPPYVIVRAGLLNRESESVLIENTVYLEKGKATLLGLTNLEQALILVLKLEM